MTSYKPPILSYLLPIDGGGLRRGKSPLTLSDDALLIETLVLWSESPSKGHPELRPRPVGVESLDEVGLVEPQGQD